MCSELSARASMRDGDTNQPGFSHTGVTLEPGGSPTDSILEGSHTNSIAYDENRGSKQCRRSTQIPSFHHKVLEKMDLPAPTGHSSSVQASSKSK